MGRARTTRGSDADAEIRHGLDDTGALMRAPCPGCADGIVESRFVRLQYTPAPGESYENEPTHYGQYRHEGAPCAWYQTAPMRERFFSIIAELRAMRRFLRRASRHHSTRLDAAEAL